tara:strand:- start:6393 stop:6926 length:534 start_codon:yes stop_codon:yes gene_type:complete
MANFAEDMLSNKWVKMSIYGMILLLIFWVLFLLVKKFFEVAFVPSEEELSEDAIKNLPDLPNEAPSSITDAQAKVIADDLESAMLGTTFDWTQCMSMFNAIDPYRDDGNALIKIYQQFGIRDGENLGAWFRGDLSQNCTNWSYVNPYPCDIPKDCYNRDESEMSCMQWYWKKSGLPI